MRYWYQSILAATFLPFLLSGCPSPTTPTTPTRMTKPTPTRIYKQNPPPPPVRPAAIPQDYLNWLDQSDHRQQVERYSSYLSRHHIENTVPMYQLLRSARDWERCGREPYAVPSSEIWHNMVPTLQMLQRMIDRKILTNFEVTSVYRDASLNSCAGGSGGSKHVHNAAIDIRLNPSYGSVYGEDPNNGTKFLLCEFWQNEGQRYSMGLGLYANGQIHLDTQGFRSWGPDYSYQTSMCNYGY